MIAILDRTNKQKKNPESGKCSAEIPHQRCIQNTPKKDLHELNIVFPSTSVRCGAPVANPRQPTNYEAAEAEAQISQSSVETRHADLKQMFTYNTVTCSCFLSMSPVIRGGLGHSSWGLNNRNTSHFPLGQRSRGSCTCVWSQIPSCLFSQSGIGGALLPEEIVKA